MQINTSVAIQVRGKTGTNAFEMHCPVVVRVFRRDGQGWQAAKERSGNRCDCEDLGG